MTNHMDPYDIAVIGGGVNGAGVARDAAGRGATVLLLEQGDLAQGTSSNSTKLIHGGLRYLEHYEFSLVREALSERERLWSIAPHIIWPLRFILPHRTGLRPRWLLRLGLFLYDHIGGRRKLPATQSVNLSKHVTGVALQDQFVHAFEYSDGWVDDARLVILNARDAANYGAHIQTRTQVTALHRVGSHWEIQTKADDGSLVQYRATNVINAAGPYVLELIHRANVETSRKMRLVRGSHIVVRRLFEHEYAYFFQLSDGRIFFAIPYEREFTLIGTTDQDHDGKISDASASTEEIAYLCDGANQYFKTRITPKDVVWTYSGVRPLMDDGDGKPESATRGYHLDLSPEMDGPALLNIFGGKITSYRHLAEEVVDKLASRIPRLTGGRWTGTKPLPGGDFPTDGVSDLKCDYRRDYPFLSEEMLDRIVKAYGTLSTKWLAGAKNWDDLGTHFGHGLSQAEVDYLINTEWARTAEDIIWRRTKLGLHFTPENIMMLNNYLEQNLEQRRDQT